MGGLLQFCVKKSILTRSVRRQFREHQTGCLLDNDVLMTFQEIADKQTALFLEY